MDYRLMFIATFALFLIILVDRTLTAIKDDKVLIIFFWGALVLFDTTALIAAIMQK